MGGGNGSVNDMRVSMHARIPAELKYLVTCYQNATRLATFNYAVQRLLETHPDLQRLAAEMYNGRQGDRSAIGG